MSDIFLADEVWRAALGPRTSKQYLGPYEPWWWVAEDEGPHDAVYLHREIDGQIRARGGTVDAGRGIRRDLRRELQTEQREAIGVKPDGTRIIIPAAAWQGTGEAAAKLWYLAEYPDPSAPENPYRIYLLVPKIALGWLPGAKQSLKNWCVDSGPADLEARARLTANKASPSEAAISRELSAIWNKAGRDGGSPESIEETRRRMR